MQILGASALWVAYFFGIGPSRMSLPFWSWHDYGQKCRIFSSGMFSLVYIFYNCLFSKDKMFL